MTQIEQIKAEIERLRNECAKCIGDGFVDGDLSKTMTSGGAAWVCERLLSFIESMEKEYTIKGWVARDSEDRLGLYDQKPTRKTELGSFQGIVNSWVIGDTWIGRFSLDQTTKTLFPNLCWMDEPIEVELMIKPRTPEDAD